MEEQIIMAILFASLFDAIMFISIGFIIVSTYLRITKKPYKTIPYIIMTIIAIIINLILLGEASEGFQEYNGFGVAVRVLVGIVVISIFVLIGVRKKRKNIDSK